MLPQPLAVAHLLRARAVERAAVLEHAVLLDHDPAVVAARRQLGAEAVEVDVALAEGAEEAAPPGGEAVGALTVDGAVAADQIYKTLIIAVPDGLAVAILPALARLSLKAAAAALGAGRATMADRRAAERASGYVLGAISPLGQRTRLPTVVDSGALGRARIYVSAGRRGWDVAVTPTDLVRLTDAVTADIHA